MIAYFDTSAFLPLFITEPGTQRCRRLWAAAEVRVVTRLVFVEASAALAQAGRLGRLTDNQHDDAPARMGLAWGLCHIRELDDLLMREAGQLARRYGLRGYDSVHCAAAAGFTDTDFAAASGDRRLLNAWSSLGVTTMDPNA